MKNKKSEIKFNFALIWSGSLAFFALLIAWSILNAQSFEVEKSVYESVFTALFWAVGGGLVYKSIKNHVVEKYGEEGFGLVKRVDIHRMEAEKYSKQRTETRVYVPGSNIACEATELKNYIIEQEYETGDYVRLKYYGGEIIISGPVESPEIITERVRMILEGEAEPTPQVDETANEIKSDTDNWILTEEAFSSKEEFEKSRRGPFCGIILKIKEKLGGLHNAYQKQGRIVFGRRMVVFVWIVAALWFFLYSFRVI